MPVSQPLSTECEADGDLCPPDHCDGAGNCVPDGPPVSCPPRMGCVDFSCNPATGACDPVPIVPCCGNNIKEADEECDGTDDAACPGSCTAFCKCPGMPAVSEWGLIALVLLLLTGMAIKFGRYRPQTR